MNLTTKSNPVASGGPGIDNLSSQIVFHLYVHNMKKITFIVLTLLLISCNEAKVNNSNVYELDMNSSKDISFDELVTGVECFQLTESGINSNSYWKIIECDPFFYLYSFDGISVYKKSGEHVRTIKNHQQGFAFIPNDMFVNEKKKQLWSIASLEYINMYSLDGQFIERQKLPFKAAKIAQAGADHYLFLGGDFDKTTSFFLRIVSDVDFSTDAEFVPKYNTDNNIPAAAFTYNTDQVFIYLPFNDTIYVCDNKHLNVTPKWRLNFSGDFLTHHDIPEGGYSDKRFAEIIKENRKYRGIQGVHNVNKLLLMQLQGRDNSFRAIDITTNNICRFHTLIDNITTYPKGSTPEGLLVVMNVQDFVRHYSHPANSTKYESIREFLNKINEHMNGLIVLKIKLREDLP